MKKISLFINKLFFFMFCLSGVFTMTYLTYYTFTILFIDTALLQSSNPILSVAVFFLLLLGLIGIIFYGYGTLHVSDIIDKNTEAK